MSELKKLQEEFEQKVKNLQKNCPHKEFGFWKHVEDDVNILTRFWLVCGKKQEDVVHKRKYVGRTPQGGLGKREAYEEVLGEGNKP